MFCVKFPQMSLSMLTGNQNVQVKMKIKGKFQPFGKGDFLYLHSWSMKNCAWKHFWILRKNNFNDVHVEIN